MNNLFNAKRFGRLFIKHTTEHYKTYLMALAVLIGVMLLGGSFLVYMLEAPVDMGMQYALFSSIYFLAGSIFTSTVFADFGDSKKAVSSLTLPASNFEKFMVGWVFSFVIFTVVFTAVFYLILLILINVQRQPNPPHELINPFERQELMVFLLFSLLHSITIFGAIFFKKLHFIKTAFCFFISIAVIILLNTIFLRQIIGHPIRPAIPFGNIDLADDNIAPVYGNRVTDFAVVYLVLMIAIIFWTATFYRLKEKQA
jgi:hypothetical protein